MNYIIFLAIVSVAVIATYLFEYYEWNGGVCRTSGLPWKYLGVCSEGTKQYTDGDGNYIRLFWGVSK